MSLLAMFDHGNMGSRLLSLDFPLHPILVNFTAALVPVSVGSDFFSRLLGRDSLRHTGWWTLFYAVLVTPLTAAAGWYWLRDMGGMDAIEMDIHKWLGTSLAFLLAILTVWRWRLHRRGAVPTTAYLCTGLLVVAVLTFQGHLGGSMSFGTGTQMHSGVTDHAEEPVNASGGQSAPGYGGIEWRDAIEVDDHTH